MLATADISTIQFTDEKVSHHTSNTVPLNRLGDIWSLYYSLHLLFTSTNQQNISPSKKKVIFSVKYTHGISDCRARTMKNLVVRQLEYLTHVCVLLALRNGPVPAKGEERRKIHRGEKESQSKDERKGEDWRLDRTAVNTSL